MNNKEGRGRDNNRVEDSMASASRRPRRFESGRRQQCAVSLGISRGSTARWWGSKQRRESVTTLLNCCRSVFFSYTTTTMFKKESVGHFLHFQVL